MRALAKMQKGIDCYRCVDRGWLVCVCVKRKNGIYLFLINMPIVVFVCVYILGQYECLPCVFVSRLVILWEVLPQGGVGGGGVMLTFKRGVKPSPLHRSDLFLRTLYTDTHMGASVAC